MNKGLWIQRAISLSDQTDKVKVKKVSRGASGWKGNFKDEKHGKVAEEFPPMQEHVGQQTCLEANSVQQILVNDNSIMFDHRPQE